MSDSQYSAWNPGIVSKIPEIYEEMETIFHPDNMFTSLAEVDELARGTGLSHEELVVL